MMSAVNHRILIPTDKGSHFSERFHHQHPPGARQVDDMPRTRRRQEPEVSGARGRVQSWRGQAAFVLRFQTGGTRLASN